jgi:hypothetical protein
VTDAVRPGELAYSDLGIGLDGGKLEEREMGFHLRFGRGA